MNDQPITRQELTETKRLQWAAWGISVLLVVAGTMIGVRFPDLPPIPADTGPQLNAEEVRAIAAAEFDRIITERIQRLDDPYAEQPAATSRGFHSNFTGLVVEVPTSVATATPAAVIDSLGVSNLLEVRDAATPVARFENGGQLQLLTGALGLSFADLAVSDGDTITPTYSVYALDTSGAVTVTLAASADEGQLLVLINDDANATIIADTNIRTSDGNAITLAGAYDAAVFIYQDSDWLQLLSIAGS